MPSFNVDFEYCHYGDDAPHCPQGDIRAGAVQEAEKQVIEVAPFMFR